MTSVIRKSSKKELSSDRVMNLLNQGANAIYVTDPDTGRFTYVNDRASETLGYDRQQLIGKHISEVEVNFGQTIEFQDFLSELRKHPRFTIEGKHQRKDGSTLPVSVDVDLITDDGKEYVLSVVRPLDEKNEEEDAIKEEYSRYLTLFKHSPTPLWNFDLSDVHATVANGDGTSDNNPTPELSPDRNLRTLLLQKARIVDINDSSLDLLGAEDKQEIVDNLVKFLTPSLKDKIRSILNDMFQGTYRGEFELTLPTIDGQTRTVTAYYMVPPDSREDFSQVFISLIDVTPRRKAKKQAEKHRKELEKSEKQFRQMAENIDEVFYNYAPDYSEVYYVSPAYETIWERDIEALRDDPWQFAEAIYEDDRDRTIEEKKDFTNSGSEGKLTQEYRIVTPEGQVKWIRDEMFTVNNQGSLERIVGSAKDITEKKKTQQTLQDSLEEKKTLLREIHHRVKNNMQIVVSLLRMQLRTLESESDKEAFLNSIERVKAMALIHEKLYQADRLSKLDIKAYLEELCEHLLNFHDRELIDVNISVDIDISPQTDWAIACGLIVNELVVNSLKHGFGEGENGEIQVHLRKNGREIRLTVSDNGRGMTEESELEHSSSTGLELIKALVNHELNGSFNIQSEDGFTTTVRFEP
ncbi:MAG: PAS domain S-box protein [bacterium]